MNQCESVIKQAGPDWRPALMVMRFIRLHPGAQKGGGPIGGRCSDLATSKTSLPTLNEQRNHLLVVLTQPGGKKLHTTERYFIHPSPARYKELPHISHGRDKIQAESGAPLNIGRILTLPPISWSSRVHPNGGCGGLRSRR